MSSTTIGSSYRHKPSGVVGKAVAQVVDPEGARAGNTAVPLDLTQLALNPEHLTGDSASGVPQGFDMRWYPDAELEDAAPSQADA